VQRWARVYLVEEAVAAVTAGSRRIRLADFCVETNVWPDVDDVVLVPMDAVLRENRHMHRMAKQCGFGLLKGVQSVGDGLKRLAPAQQRLAPAQQRGRGRRRRYPACDVVRVDLMCPGDRAAAVRLFTALRGALRVGGIATGLLYGHNRAACEALCDDALLGECGVSAVLWCARDEFLGDTWAPPDVHSAGSPVAHAHTLADTDPDCDYAVVTAGAPGWSHVFMLVAV
jgi:hypothetical protein